MDLKHRCVRMQARCKEKHLQEDDRMDLPDPLTEPDVPGKFKNAITRGEYP